MPNISIRDDSDSIPRAEIRMRAIKGDIGRQVKEIVSEAAHDAARTARMLAPRGVQGRRIGRIRDAIREEPVEYRPGGPGGGGSYVARVWVDEDLAPQVEYVYAGTPREDPGGIIRPKHGNLGGMSHRGVLAIVKKGEPVRFRMFTRGQRPNKAWWDMAQRRAEFYAERKISELDI
jgi:hypothetical protein